MNIVQPKAFHKVAASGGVHESGTELFLTQSKERRHTPINNKT